MGKGGREAAAGSQKWEDGKIEGKPGREKRGSGREGGGMFRVSLGSVRDGWRQ